MKPRRLFVAPPPSSHPSRVAIELASALLQVAKERAPLGVALEGKSLWSVVNAAPLLR